MRTPQKPPKLKDLFGELKDPGRLAELFGPVRRDKSDSQYLHWDKLRRLDPPEGISHREWWMVLKLSRSDSLKFVNLKDLQGEFFQFSVPEVVMAELHQIDLGAGGSVSIPEPITNPQTRDRYLVRSLMEEAITSSQLEGAVTTREVAKEMIRTGREPRNTSEQMILNNFVTMQSIGSIKSSPLSPELVFEVHRLVTDKTLEKPDAAGRFRKADEPCVVADDFGNVYHQHLMRLN